MKRILDEKPEEFIVQMFQDKTFADVIFQVEDQKFPAHKCFLSVRCPYFKNVFTSFNSMEILIFSNNPFIGNMMESQNKVIPVPDERAEVFKG